MKITRNKNSKGADLLDRTPDRFVPSPESNKYLNAQQEKRYIQALQTIFDVFHDDPNVELCYGIIYGYGLDFDKKLKWYSSKSEDTRQRPDEIKGTTSYPEIGLVIKFKESRFDNLLREYEKIGINPRFNYTYAPLIHKGNIEDVVKILQRATRSTALNNIKL